MVIRLRNVFPGNAGSTGEKQINNNIFSITINDSLYVLTTFLFFQQTNVQLDYVGLSGILGRHVAGDTRFDGVQG